ncbi:MAG: NAD(P)H-dependent glycerol-3-phosphate dehydrogenase [Vicinamibacterales bacterium]
MAVLGAGSWGTALALHLARQGHAVRIWGRDPALIAQLRLERRNPVYLTDAVLPESVCPTDTLPAAIAGVDYVVVAVPSHGLRTLAEAMVACLPEAAVVVSTTKGIEEGSLLRASEVLHEVLSPRQPVVVLSGPSFAAEVARQLPTAVLAASNDGSAASAVQCDFRGASLRLYASSDVTGVELGGAVKNVIAIAAGVVESLGLGQNALAALITRGLAEMSRLAGALGGKRETLAGLSGLGDLVLTCTSGQSRNRFVGLELGRGRQLPEILSGMRMVAEGVRTTHAVLALGLRHGIELPITEQMEQVLRHGKDPRQAVTELMLRPQRAEDEPRTDCARDQ